ncbi:Arginine/Asparagine/Proline hydroxylase, partial [Pelagophyceae sp. CCMP2097]
EHVLHGGEWRWLSFVTKGERREALRAPKTRTLLDAVPRLMTGVPFGFAFYSSLQPGAEIAPHTAPMNLRLRVHIALRVPPGDCALRVAGETHTWRPSEALVFDDAYVHSAWNRTDQERVLLLFDVWHPDLKDDEIAAITDMFRRAA